MDERLRQTVREPADHRCEYCCLPQDAEPFFAYHVEHIVARQHGGGDDSGNLALACYHCNAHKGPNLSGLQPLSTKVRIKMGSSAGVCVAVLPSLRRVGSFLISSIPAPEKAKDSPGFPFLALYYRRANNRPTGKKLR